jgi:threonine dehydrogenase-like Zn-dependent dehydrogenase
MVHLEEIQMWADENHRIETGELDYAAIIGRHQERLEEVRAAFEAMDENTY